MTSYNRSGCFYKPPGERLSSGNEKFPMSRLAWMAKRMQVKKLLLALLCVTFLAPIVLYNDWFSVAPSSILRGGFVEEGSTPHQALAQDLMLAVKEPLGISYTDSSSTLDQDSTGSVDEWLPLSKQGLGISSFPLDSNRASLLLMTFIGGLCRLHQSSCVLVKLGLLTLLMLIYHGSNSYRIIIGYI